VISVDWNSPQTEFWLHYLKKNCPTANIILIDDAKPMNWNWSSGKINCFKYDFPHPERVIYMDTDTIVTRDLEPLFEMYPASLAGSLFIPMMSPLHPRSRYGQKEDIAQCTRAFGLQKNPRHWSTGFLMLQNYPLMRLYEEWLAGMDFSKLKVAFKRCRVYEELVFSYVVERMAREGYNLAELPHEIHGNIMSGERDFGTCREEKNELPYVIHYHQTRRLRQVKLESLDVSVKKA
jgi:hypothetical protein